jgi:DNA-binding transcriptional LysR family regulator
VRRLVASQSAGRKRADEMPVGYGVDTPALLPHRLYLPAGNPACQYVASGSGILAMEMHQVRYFLAVSRTQNFTRAADECNVTQPSLTRAIKQLEYELGGDLFFRERPASQLTELGQRMLPFLQQCYNAAAEARSVATSFKSGEVGALKLALSRTIDLTLLLPFLNEMSRVFKGIEFKFPRGNAQEVTEFMKKGDAELGLAAARSDDWDRLDAWPLFDEPFDLAVSREHKLANEPTLRLEQLKGHRLLRRTYCEHAERIDAVLKEKAVDTGGQHDISSERDLMKLLESGVGLAILPRSTATGADAKRIRIEDLDLTRTVFLYGIAGRQRSAIAATMAKLLRAADWTKLTESVSLRS